MTRSICQRLHAQFKKVIKDNNEYYTCCMDTENIQTWYVLITNLPDPYTDGEYIFKLTIPNEFPDNPPSFSALTPNGVMEMGGKICVSVGEFHRNDHHKSNSKGDYGWIPSLGISGFVLQGIINAMLSFDTKDHGVRLSNMTDEQKRRLGKLSKEYNLEHNKNIMDLFQIHKECFPDLKCFTHP